MITNVDSLQGMLIRLSMSSAISAKMVTVDPKYVLNIPKEKDEERFCKPFIDNFLARRIVIHVITLFPSIKWDDENRVFVDVEKDVDLKKLADVKIITVIE